MANDVHELSAPGADPLAARLTMLAVVSLGFLSLTLNWFDIAAAFGLIARPPRPVDLWNCAARRLRGVLRHVAAPGRVRRHRPRLQPPAGGLLAALIGLAGIPGGIVGGMLADRSRNIRAFVVGPLLIIAVLLALIPFVPAAALWMLGIGIGFFLLFGFAAWSSVPVEATPSGVAPDPVERPA